MKKTEIAVVVLIGGVSLFISWWMIDMLLGDPFARVEKVEYMDKITNSLEKPDPEIFNRDAINPTVDVIIGREDEQASEATDQQGANTDETQTGSDQASSGANNTNTGGTE